VQQLLILHTINLRGTGHIQWTQGGHMWIYHATTWHVLGSSCSMESLVGSVAEFLDIFGILGCKRNSLSPERGCDRTYRDTGKSVKSAQKLASTYLKALVLSLAPSVNSDVTIIFRKIP